MNLRIIFPEFSLVEIFRKNGVFHEKEERQEKGLSGKLIFLKGGVDTEDILTQLQKPKLRVGKARAKADNFTDTSFKAKCEFVVNFIPRCKCVQICPLCFCAHHQQTESTVVFDQGKFRCSLPKQKKRKERDCTFS